MIIYLYVLAVLSVGGFMLMLTKMALLSKYGQKRNGITIKHIGIMLLLIFIATQLVCCKDTATTTANSTGETTREPEVIGQEEDEDIAVVKQTDADGKITATVTISNKNGDEVTTEERIFTGTPQEVDAQIKALSKKK